MNITIRLTKVEYEILKELHKKDKRYQRGLKHKTKGEIAIHFGQLKFWLSEDFYRREVKCGVYG